MSETTNMVADLAKVQGGLPTIKKDKKGAFGSYASLEAVHEVALPLLSANNLAWSTLPGEDDAGNPVLDYKLLHTSGDSLEGRMRLMVSQPNSQQMGSAITYARRFAICAVVGITADEDDDGTQATKAPYKKPEPKPLPTKVEEAPQYQGDQLVPFGGDDMITPAQSKFLKDLMFNKHGIKTPKDAKLAFKVFAGQEIAKVEDLTKIRGSEMIDHLTKLEQHEVQGKILEAA